MKYFMTTFCIPEENQKKDIGKVFENFLVDIHVKVSYSTKKKYFLNSCYQVGYFFHSTSFAGLCALGHTA